MKNGMTCARFHAGSAVLCQRCRFDKFTDHARHAADSRLAMALVLADDVPAVAELDGRHIGVTWRCDRVGRAGQQQYRQIGRQWRAQIFINYTPRGQIEHMVLMDFELQRADVTIVNSFGVEACPSR